MLHGDHVRVDVLYARFSPRAKLMVEVAAAVIGMVFSLLVIWLSLAYVNQSWSIGEGSANPGGLDYRYIIKAMIPLGFALLFLQSLGQALRAVLALRAA
jgi:TRAP-type mannitol/chloroaromatic compound transport system permease small subunit